MSTLTLTDLRQDIELITIDNKTKDLIIDLICCYEHIEGDPLGELIQSVKDLYTEQRLRARAYDMACYAESDVHFHVLIKPYINVFKILQKLFNCRKYQKHWNSYCDSLL